MKVFFRCLSIKVRTYCSNVWAFHGSGGKPHPSKETHGGPSNKDSVHPKRNQRRVKWGNRVAVKKKGEEFHSCATHTPVPLHKRARRERGDKDGKARMGGHFHSWPDIWASLCGDTLTIKTLNNNPASSPTTDTHTCTRARPRTAKNSLLVCVRAAWARQLLADSLQKRF